MRFYKKIIATHVLTIFKVHQCLIEVFKYSDRIDISDVLSGICK